MIKWKARIKKRETRRTLQRKEKERNKQTERILQKKRLQEKKKERLKGRKGKERI